MSFQRRYANTNEAKATGATYTPTVLADFVSRQIADHARCLRKDTAIRILDPSVGDGELLRNLISHLRTRTKNHLEIIGFDTDGAALESAETRLNAGFSKTNIRLFHRNFLEFVEEEFGTGRQVDLFQQNDFEPFDIVIANPPYVRTQIMGAEQAQYLSKKYGLTGRVDLYFPFIISIAQTLKEDGIAGIITSNRFLTTKSGSSMRSIIQSRYKILHIWDLGDTKLFDAAVLPSVMLLEHPGNGKTGPIRFTSIYQTEAPAEKNALDPIDALQHEGIVEIRDGRCFHVRHGTLGKAVGQESVWSLSTGRSRSWLDMVKKRTWGTFSDVGKIRVGVKTCADKVFVRSDWQDIPEDELPELLRPLTTHHIARRYRAFQSENPFLILYPHETNGKGGKQPVDLSLYPKSLRYLNSHEKILKGRDYVVASGRQWYEIWVPQDPAAWNLPKLVFRDIVKEPVFWIDLDNTIINGDCYWLACKDPSQTDLLWLAAAVGNSSFIECFYDNCFNNKLYAGRRRFLTQYVRHFPLPDPKSKMGKQLIESAKMIYSRIASSEAEEISRDMDRLVWNAFDLSVEEVVGQGNL